MTSPEATAVFPDPSAAPGVYFGFDNTYARLEPRYYARLSPTPVRAPQLIQLNVELARSLGLDPVALAGPAGVDHSKSAVLDSLRSRESKRGYRHAIDEFIQWYCSEPRLSLRR